VGHRVENVSDPYIILELIQASTDYNTDLIARHGELLHCVTFTKKTNPLEGIFWRQSIPASYVETDPVIIDVLRKIVARTNYDGFANIDYMYQGQRPQIFDFNPRPSGTLLRFGAPVMAVWLKKYSACFQFDHPRQPQDGN